MALAQLPDGSAAPVIDLDMDAVYFGAAIPTKHWHVEFTCDGRPFVWHGKGKSGAYAELCARSDLSDQCADFDRYGARLVSLAYSHSMWPCGCEGRWRS